LIAFSHVALNARQKLLEARIDPDGHARRNRSPAPAEQFEERAPQVLSPGVPEGPLEAGFGERLARSLFEPGEKVLQPEFLAACEPRDQLFGQSFPRGIRRVGRIEGATHRRSLAEPNPLIRAHLDDNTFFLRDGPAADTERLVQRNLHPPQHNLFQVKCG